MISTFNAYRPHTQSYLESFSLLCLLAMASLVLLKFFALLSFGFDLTDEGFYVQSVMNAQSYERTVSKFGDLLTPLWAVSAENIIHYRRLFWLLLGLACACVAWRYLSLNTLLTGVSSASLRGENRDSKRSVFQRFVLTVGITTSLILTQRHWLPTPNYNLLGVLFLLLFAYGLWLLNATSKLGLSSVIIGVSGALLFLSKATSAAILAVILILVVAGMFNKTSAKMSVSFLFCCALAAVITLFIFSVLLFGGPVQYVLDLQAGLTAASTMNGPDWGSFQRLIWNGRAHSLIDSQASVLLVVCLIFGGIGLVANLSDQRGPTDSRRPVVLRFKQTINLILAWVNLALVMVGGYWCVLVLFYDQPSPLQKASFYYIAVLVWGALLANLVGGWVAQAFNKGLSLQSVFLVLALFSIPYAYAFGTGTSYWSLIQAVPVFGIIACGFLNRSLHGFLPIIVGTVVMAAFTLPINGNKVYRQLPLDINHVAQIKSGLDHSPVAGVWVDQNAAAYYLSLSTLAQQAGFKKDTEVIDLTGASPGAISYLGGRGVGAAWVLGGYPGSDAMARFLFSGVDERVLKGAWVLNSNWRRSIDANVLKDLGLDLQRDYVLVGQVEVPAGYGGRKTPELQSLYKPKFDSPLSNH